MHALGSALRDRGGYLQAGLKHDPNSEELKEGIRRTVEAMSKVCFVHDHTLHTSSFHSDLLLSSTPQFVLTEGAPV
jgi:hypothetical protein